jgi:hypothetical protein
MILGAQASADHTATARPDSVTPGAKVAFDVYFKLAATETSSLSQLYLKAKTPTGAELLGLEPGSPSQGSCTTAVDLSCTFGAVKPGDVITVRVVYRTPTSGPSLTVPFKFDTTGVANDKGKNSHGDSYETPGVVALDGSGDFAGRYIRFDETDLTVKDNQILHATRNPQSTLVNAPAGAIGVTVGEAAGNTAVCPAAAGSCFGQWSLVSVNNGAGYTAGFSVVIGYKGNIGNASFVHLFDDYDAVTNPTRYELIEYVSTDPDDPTDICSSSTPSAAELPCMILSTANGNSFATLWLNQNGRLSGY